MLTVVDLAMLLACYPPETPVAVLQVARTGASVDAVSAGLVTVQAGIDDDGTPGVVWLLTVDTAPTPQRQPPPIVSWPCACGDMVTAVGDDRWPTGHDHRD